MNVVDSSGWLEYFADDPNAAFFAPAIEDTEKLIVPTISVFEVYKRIHQQRDEDAAIQAVAAMLQATVIDLDMTLSLEAAKLSMDLKLPMADSIILATANAHDALLWTQDSDFAQVDGINFVAKLAPPTVDTSDIRKRDTP